MSIIITYITWEYLLIYLQLDSYWDKSLDFDILKYSKNIYSTFILREKILPSHNYLYN